MNILEILGCIGGTLYLVRKLIRGIYAVVGVINKYKKYKDAYERLNDDDKEKIIGFKTPDKKELFEKEKDIKIPENEGYFDMYWESEPVDNEFIEEEEDEDWEDKYPDLHIER